MYIGKIYKGGPLIKTYKFCKSSVWKQTFSTLNANGEKNDNVNVRQKCRQQNNCRVA